MLSSSTPRAAIAPAKRGEGGGMNAIVPVKGGQLQGATAGVPEILVRAGANGGLRHRGVFQGNAQQRPHQARLQPLRGAVPRLVRAERRGTPRNHSGPRSEERRVGKE